MRAGQGARARFPWLTVPLLLPLLLAACVPMFAVNRYISLKGYPDARVVERGRVALGQQGFFVGERPIRYTIERTDYTLVIERNEDAEFPKVDILVQPTGLRVVEFIGQHRVDFPSCVYQQESAYDQFQWTYFITCDGGFDKLEKVIRFNVRDLEGNLLGTEAIPYEIKRNGFFMYFDAV